MSTFVVQPPKTLAIALGANLPSKYGPPASTLVAVRGFLSETIYEWISFSVKENLKLEVISKSVHMRWSPLFQTKPLGGNANQSDFINAVVVINGPLIQGMEHSEIVIMNLLERTLMIEKNLGRVRGKNSERWGPRTIDIDLLAWGDLHVKNKKLTLPHPRLIERDFVLIPLSSAVENKTSLPKQLPPRTGWME
tara:strand:+ start:1261 stop:1842 length:582 start_codon:yes stop_codon:yes gene_type:complete